MLSNDPSLDPHRLFGAIDFSRSARVVAAVSGGGDSLALLLLLHEYLKDRPAGARLLAVTVDHRLRPESAQEAEQVGRFCETTGISHRILRWKGPKPATGISEAARDARFRLLSQAAEEAGAGLVFTGHTADDQAETVAMRQARGSGRGLAGIAPATLIDGRVWFVRPLLAARRDDLRRILRQRDTTWIEDPTNRDRRFERVRLRQSLKEKDIGHLVDAARQTAGAREEEGRQAGDIISRYAEHVAPGLLRLERSGLQRVRPHIALYAFRILLAVVGGRSHLPAEDRSEDILSQAGRARFRATLSRAVAAFSHGQIYFYRESRNLSEARIADGLVWDGRYRIRWNGNRKELSIAPVGAARARTMDIKGFPVPAEFVRAALAAQPAIWSGREWLGPAEGMPYLSLQPLAAPWARFLPCFDLAPARAVLELLGGDAIPALPWRSHKKA